MEVVLAVKLHVNNHIIPIDVEIRKVLMLLISDLNVSVIYGFSKESPIRIYGNSV